MKKNYNKTFDHYITMHIALCACLLVSEKLVQLISLLFSKKSNNPRSNDLIFSFGIQISAAGDYITRKK